MKLLTLKTQIIILVVIAALPRLLWLHSIPTGISNDELDYAINAKALWHTGRGLTGATSPINISPDFPYAELPSVLIAPIVGPFPFSLFLSRLPFALLGIATVLLLYAVMQTLLSPGIAFAAAVLAAINPWNIFFSRTMYDAPVTTFFLLLSFWLVLSGKPKRILISILPLLAAFHTYMGMMVLFPFFIVVISLYSWLYISRKHNTRYYAAMLCICALAVIRYAVFLPSSAGARRLPEVSSPTSTRVTDEVNDERKLSLINPFISLYANKGVVFAKQTIENYANAFSPSVLFFHGDSKHIFTVFAHGLFYPTDAILIVLGFCYLYATKKRQWNLLLILLAVAPIPAAISALPSYASRVYLVQPILLTFAGAGVYALLEKKKTNLKRFVLLCLAVLYIIEIANFSSVYFLRNPVHNSESYSFSTRVAASFASREADKGKTVVFLADKPQTIFKHYSFYTDLLTEENEKEYVKEYQTGTPSFGSMRWMSCPVGTLPEDSTIIVSGELTLCPTFTPPPGKPMIIAHLADGGSLLKIYQGKTCADQQLERYPHDIQFGDLSVESLTDERFCTALITRY